MRTIKRKALLLNHNKDHCLKKLCQAYAKEKQYWLDKLKAWEFQALLGKPSKIEQAVRHRIACYIRRAVKKLKGSPPKVKRARIVKFDANCYEVFNHENRQYIKLMTLEKGKRIVIPLIEFKALAKGFRHEQVNPAYGSQSCPKCEFVDYKNRTGDNFKCLFCRYEDMADRVAAMNYARRYGDPEIGLYTPCNQVKTILLNRFHRRLETGQPVTVPGRTLDTVTEVYPPPSRGRNVIAGREEILVHRAVNQRAKQNKYI
jgi:hypothetical protein